MKETEMDKQWEELTPDERYEQMFQTWYAADGVEFVDAAAEERYHAALLRFKDALQLRQPDRVPYMPLFEMFPAYYKGLTVRDAMYDYKKLNEAWKQTLIEVDGDLYLNPILAYPGRGFEALGYNLIKWPGHGLTDNQMYQFVEGEYMKADEYDEFMFDPTDYMLRKYYPRVFGILEPFQALPPMHNGIWLGMLGWTAGFANPDIAKAFEDLVEAGKTMLDWFISLVTFDAEMKALGQPNMVGGMTFAPFDMLGDTMRGTRGIMLDMLRQPDKLLEAIDKITPIAIDMGVSSGKAAGNPMVWMFLHKGPGGFMSDEQFNTFYWPSLRKLLLALIDEGLTPCVYTEGDYTPRLEALADVPRGKVLYHFENVDIHKAKKVLGDVACIAANVPLALLATGTEGEVIACCKEIIDVVGKGGGLVVDTDAVDEAKPENIMAMSKFVKEYGVYR
jgi:hypothetical protein